MKHGDAFQQSYFFDVSDIDFEVDRSSFEQDEIVYNATLCRADIESLEEGEGGDQSEILFMCNNSIL